MMDREEQRLRRSAFRVRDDELQRYLQNIVCKLGGTHCADVRVHVVRTPLFNASMAPNGMMQVWSGLLLRVENEAQLAAVLGHELGHYLERHTLERLRDLKGRAAFGQFMALFGAVGSLVQLGVLASAFAFSRDQEARADKLGMQLLRKAGYDGRQAALVWGNLLDELRVTGGDDAGKRSPLFATHPPVENRRDELLAMAGDKGGQLGTSAFQAAIAAHRRSWIQDEVLRGQYEESLVLFSRMLRHDPADAHALLGRAEVYRLRADSGDSDRALHDLATVATLPDPPPAAFRTQGLVHKQRGEAHHAISAFERYLSSSPHAVDSALIKSYLSEMKP